MIDQLEAQAQEIQTYCEIQVSDNTAEISERIATLAAYHSRTCLMLAEAKHILNQAMFSEVIQLISRITDGKYSAKVQNALVDSVARRERRLVDWIDRLNSTCKHQMDACRSLLSFEKENLRIAKQGY